MFSKVSMFSSISKSSICSCLVVVVVVLEVVVVSLLRCRSRQRPIRDSKSNEVDLQEVEVLLVRQLVVELSVEVVVDVHSCAKVRVVLTAVVSDGRQ